MRRRALARVVATAFVALLCAAPATKDPPGLDIFPSPASSQPYPTNSQPLVYFTVFNSGGDNLAVNVHVGGADGQCAATSVMPLDNARGQTGLPIILAPSELQEFEATPVMLSSSLSCAATVDATEQDTGNVLTQTLTLDFTIGDETTTLDAQPAQVSYGTRFAADLVAQVVHVTNLGTGSATETIAVTAGMENVTLSSEGTAICNSSLCTASLLPQGGVDVLVTCAPQDTTPVTIEVSDGTNMQELTVTCSGEALAQSSITLTNFMMTAADGTMATAAVNVVGDAGTLLTDAYLLTTDTSIQFQVGSGSPCNLNNGTYCQFGAGQDISVPLALTCIAHGTEMQTATLIAHGQSDLDTAVATVSCVASGGGPILVVQPGPTMPLAFGNQAVATTSGPMTVTVGDSSMASASLTNVAVSIDDGTDFALSCGSASSCSLGTIAPGQTQQFNVTFRPGSPMSYTTTVRVTATGVGEQDVMVTGTGTGVAIVLDQPDPNGVPFGIHFGSIGRGSAQTATIEITANGTLSTTTVVEPMFTGDPLFTLSGTDIDLAGGGQSGSVTLSCGSDTAGSASGEVTLATSNAYAGSNIVIPVDCTVAPTDVSASPNMVRFGDQYGELRRDDHVAPQMQTITLSNAGAGTSTIGTVTMQTSSGHVTFTQPATSVGAGASTSFQITVTPDATNSSGQTFDEDFTTKPLVLTIPVDGTMLTVTVTGKVVKAQTSLAPMPPMTLDLGTVCIGGTGMATALLSNVGTAHVGTMTPMVGSGFTIAVAGSAELAPGSGAAAQETATVASVAATAGGEVDGTLTWTTDVPDDYQLAVKVVYVATGLGVSPDTLPFGEQPDGTISTAKTVTVQNCGTGSATATIGEVDNHVGPASAWQVSQQGAYPLAPGQVMTVAVAFAPQHGGHYYAELPIATGGVTTDIELTGDAPGPADQSQTDFYACGCHGPGVPRQGWPVAAVIVGVVRRRKRRRP